MLSFVKIRSYIIIFYNIITKKRVEGKMQENDFIILKSNHKEQELKSVMFPKIENAVIL